MRFLTNMKRLTVLNFAIKFKDKDANTLREIADKIRDKNESCAIILALGFR